jgi:alpha-tubulin suppressor-like RCC1 family protein
MFIMKNLIILFTLVLMNTTVHSQCWKIIKSDGSNQTFAIKNDGTLWGWGHNNFGQIGDGTHGDGTNKSSPTQIGIDSDWETIAVGLYHSVALKTNGTLWTWGLNLTGELGDGTYDYGTEKYIPTQIGTATDWKSVAAGAYHSLAIKNDGSLWA